MTEPEAAAAYLRGLGLEAVFAAAWVKVGRYGVTGRLPTTGLSGDELRALESLLGERVLPGRPVRVQQLDAALRRSRFACGLDAVALAWFGPHAETPAAAAARREADAAALLARVGGVWTGPAAPGTPAAVLRREFLKAWRDGGAALATLERAAQAVARVLADPPAARGEAALLGILANRETGDPHAFDAGTVGGRLLLGALGSAAAGGALHRQAALAGAGIAVDGISSTVVVYGVAGDGEVVSGAAAHAGQVLVAPLRGVVGWTLAPGVWRDRVVHVVENPPVFEGLVDRGLPPGAALICTAGFPSAAAVTLLGHLARAGARVRYGGDFDGNGLQIARRVLAMGGASFGAWRMGPEAYQASLRTARGRPVRAPEERGTLEAMAAGGDDDLALCAAAILQAGAVAYQESLVPDLWADVWRSAGATPTTAATGPGGAGR